MSRSWNSRFVGTIVYSDNNITSAACVTRVVATVTRRRRRRNHRVNGKKKSRVGPQLIPKALGRLGNFPGSPLSPPGDNPSRYDASDRNSRAGRGAPNTYPYLNSRNVRMVNNHTRVDNKSVKVGQVHAGRGCSQRVRDLLMNL